MACRKIDEAIDEVIKFFPFEDYLCESESRLRLESIASAIQKYLKPNSSILDFGCGPCDNTAVLQSLGHKCSGCDDLQDDWHKIPGNKEKILKFASDRGITFKVLEDGRIPYEKESFDVAMSNDVLEHLPCSPRDLLNDLLELVKPGGILFITVPNAGNIRKRLAVLRGGTNLPSYEAYYWHVGTWRGHVREYVEGDLRQMVEYLGLEVLELRGCDHMLEKVPTPFRSLYLAATALFPRWKDSWILVARKPHGWSPKRTRQDFQIPPEMPDARVHLPLNIGRTRRAATP
jgi:SAM-dependent methyltransferase